ncbi:MAG: hypothetical protein ABIN94_01245 [Ferruginibacter sp.]
MKHFSPFGICLALLVVFTPMMAQQKNLSPHFDKAAYYRSLAGINLDEINSRLLLLNESTVAEKNAYEGALMMKKAGLINKAKDKLSTFKTGRNKLETAISNEPQNAEYSFLRLVIQENAPKIVRYRQNLKSDAVLIVTSFKQLPPDVQEAIRNYSRKSATLRPGDF